MAEGAGRRKPAKVNYAAMAAPEKSMPELNALSTGQFVCIKTALLPHCGARLYNLPRAPPSRVSAIVGHRKMVFGGLCNRWTRRESVGSSPSFARAILLVIPRARPAPCARLYMPVFVL